MKLTEIVLRNLAAPEKGQADYRDDIVPGFMCRVSRGGTKTFVLVHGKDRRRTTIGRYPVVGLADARAEAKRLLAEQTLGKRQAPRQTFKTALDAYLANHEANNRASTSAEVRRILTKQFTSLHSKQLADVATNDLTRITDRMVKAGKPSAANHAHMAVRAFLGWCVRRRLIPHSPLEGLERPTSTVTRERVLSDDELRAVWHGADMTGGSFGDIVKLLILTGQRRTEIASLKADWCSVAGQAGSAPGVLSGESQAVSTITLPREITKNGRTHRFPIGRLTANIVEPRMNAGYLFPARRSKDGADICFNGWSKAKARLDARIAVARGSEEQPLPLAAWTLHDLRRTHVTNLQRLKIPLEVREALVNHVSGESRTGVAGTYNRHRYEEEMRQAVSLHEQWFTAAILQS
jgi:integrase